MQPFIITTLHLRQGENNGEQTPEVGGPHPCSGIPSVSCGPAVRARPTTAARVVAGGDIVHGGSDTRTVVVNQRVQEAKRRLASLEATVDQQCNNPSEGGAGTGCAGNAR